MKVFKFGGASVNSADGVKNVVKILRNHDADPLLVVISAMGKTTNALEALLHHYMQNDSLSVIDCFQKVVAFHDAILKELFTEADHPVFGEVESIFNQLRGYIRKGHLYTQERPVYDFEYDQIVGYGELISSAILYHYYHSRVGTCRLIDSRDLIKTDATYRDARVNWKETTRLILQELSVELTDKPRQGNIVITQGFLGSDPQGNTTTLGREGSDFSAAIFAYAVKATEMTIWKDVPGVMNADPKWMPEAVRLETLSYREAIELAYYGASVIHPKTIKPLENGNIPLYVKSFSNPTAEGTLVEQIREWTIPVPVYIRKQNQVLISISSRDFSFILEENLSEIFKTLAQYHVKVNVMQNSAISFTICVDADRQKLSSLITFLSKDYETRYNENLELYTIRHYNEQAYEKMIRGRKILMELRSRHTLQLVLR